MDVLTVRLDKSVSKKIDSILKEFNYSTRTDFVREAIRAKITQLEEEQKTRRMLRTLEENFGKYKDPTLTWEECEARRRKAGEEYMAELEKKFNLK